MAQLFRLNEKWPYPLMPSEYVRRQFHVSFQDDPVAVACRHITGAVDDRVGQRLPARRRHVPRQPAADRRAVRRRPGDERDAMIGGTLGGLLGFKAPVAA